MVRKQNARPGQSNQSGIASIFIVMILMTVLALISLAFSHLMNREETQSLDRQLSTEAYYAAESGVNDTRYYLNSLDLASKTKTGDPSFTGCNTPANGYFVTNGNISGDNIARYSCVTLNVKPSELVYRIDPGQSVSFRMNLNPKPKALHFGWQNQSYTGAPQPLSSALPPSLGYLPMSTNIAGDNTGLLRVAFYPIKSDYKDNPYTKINTSARNYFFYPLAGAGNGGSVDYNNAAGDGKFYSGDCNSSTYPSLPDKNATQQYCNVAINNVPGADSYFVSLTALYNPIYVTVEAEQNPNKAIPIPGVQANIDSTGAANDVLQRVRAVVPIGKNYTTASYAVQSMMAICKLFRAPIVDQGQYGQPYVDPGAPNDDGACTAPFNGSAVAGGGAGAGGKIPCPVGLVGNYPDCVPPNPTVTYYTGTNYTGSSETDPLVPGGGDPYCSQYVFRTSTAHDVDCNLINGDQIKSIRFNSYGIQDLWLYLNDDYGYEGGSVGIETIDSSGNDIGVANLDTGETYSYDGSGNVVGSFTGAGGWSFRIASIVVGNQHWITHGNTGPWLPPNTWGLDP